MTEARSLGAAVALGATAALSYMLFEAQWVRRVEFSVRVAGLHPDLDGLAIAHLSDPHAGFRPSLNMRAARIAVDLAMAAQPDLIAVTGDLAGGSANLDRIKALLGTLHAPLGVFAVLGNHDHGRSKAPFTRAVDLGDLGDYGLRLLSNETVTVRRGAGRVQICGVDDVKHGFGDLRPVLAALDRRPDTLRVLLSHYAEGALEAPASSFALTLSGDTHGGQICLPWFGGPVMLSQPRAPFKDGIYDRDGRLIHVTRGIGTSLLPFRFLCRPEAAIVRLVGAPAEAAAAPATAL
jgi:predicted MPP superfamily phosphohydrolase